MCAETYTHKYIYTYVCVCVNACRQLDRELFSWKNDTTDFQKMLDADLCWLDT